MIKLKGGDYFEGSWTELTVRKTRRKKVLSFEWLGEEKCSRCFNQHQVWWDWKVSVTEFEMFEEEFGKLTRVFIGFWWIKNDFLSLGLSVWGLFKDYVTHGSRGAKNLLWRPDSSGENRTNSVTNEVGVRKSKILR